MLVVVGNKLVWVDVATLSYLPSSTFMKLDSLPNIQSKSAVHPRLPILPFKKSEIAALSIALNISSGVKFESLILMNFARFSVILLICLITLPSIALFQ